MVEIMEMQSTDLTWKEKYPFSYRMNGRAAIHKKEEETAREK